MANLGKAFTYLIAAQVQAVTFVLMAYWVGDWLNKNHPAAFNWYIVTFVVGVLGIAQTFYVVIRAAMSQGQDGVESTKDGPDKTSRKDRPVE
ncbi:MAG: hypothetical protein FJ146_03595 [Deltaproteobacteria bacterium]|nr:hypothetical protein [Deltaproteobacteria bacterium]